MMRTLSYGRSPHPRMAADPLSRELARAARAGRGRLLARLALGRATWLALGLGAHFHRHALTHRRALGVPTLHVFERHTVAPRDRGERLARLHRVVDAPVGDRDRRRVHDR